MELEISDEEEIDRADPALVDVFQPPMSPGASLKLIQRQEEIKNDFVHFLKANEQCNSDLQQGKTLIPPILRSGSIVRNLENSFKLDEQKTKVKITLEDIEDEVLFGNLQLDQVLNGGYIFFNRRPVIMKPWDPNVNFKKEDVKSVPIWIQLEDLELKYWGERSSFKIVGQMGNPIMVDAITRDRERQNYPRVLIEVNMDRNLQGMLELDDEHGSNTSIGVKNEWKPSIYTHCSGLCHVAAKCRKHIAGKKGWIVKADHRKVK
uniref:DUF4283 domain-containing protein n=1 Tax=Cannabis sativa TaxID=3483 RepID=A0A803PUJ7_CANSA